MQKHKQPGEESKRAGEATGSSYYDPESESRSKTVTAEEAKQPNR
jgi:hypothetical protein